MANNQIVKDTDVGAYLKANETALAAYALRDYEHNAFARSAMIAICENKDLRACLATDQGKASMYHALKFAATTGLSLNPQEGRAALIPYGNKIQYQIMKNGLIELAMNSGKISALTSDIVRENDRFAVAKSIDGDTYRHEPAITDRGPVIGYYAACKLSDGGTHVKYMTSGEIDEHCSKAQCGPVWQKWRDPMALKTCIKALLRNLHLSPVATAGIGADDEAESMDIIAGSAEISQRGTSSSNLSEKLDAPNQDPELTAPVERSGDVL